MRLFSRISFVVAFLLTIITFPAAAQVSLTTLGTPSTQNFDSLASTGTNTWTDNTTPLAGWYSQFSLQAANPITYVAGTGSSATGALYSFGVAGTNAVTDRA